MGAPSSPGRNSEKRSGNTSREVALTGINLTEAGLKGSRKPAPGLQRWRIRAASDSAGGPLRDCLPDGLLRACRRGLTPGLPADPEADWFGTYFAPSEDGVERVPLADAGDSED
jgi:hypothetical protein